IPPAPEPGEIGNLNVANIDAKPVEPQTAPEVDGNENEGQTVTKPVEEEAAEAAGSKSEHAPDNDIQPEDPEPETELTEEELKALQGPTEEDVTPIGEKIAKKTEGKL